MISLQNVSKSFDKKILENFNINFEDGCTTVLLGPSGSGKTTIVNLVLGLIKADAGKICGADGIRPSVVFQEDRLLERITVIENLKAVCSDDVSCRRILEKLDLGEDCYKYPYELSGGMKRRLALARAMVYNGNPFMMDEPFKGIDIALKERVINEVKAALNGKTAIIITHEIEDAVALGDKIVILGDNPLKILKTVDNTGEKEVVTDIENFIKKNNGE